MTTGQVTILYGSETGNSQDYAHYLARRLRYHSISPIVSSLDDFPLKKLVTDTRVLVVICSTTGQGEIPRNGKKFMRFLLKKKLPLDLLNHLLITTFGLGDSSYPKFNYAIKKIHTRLLQLGCTELCPRCESDEISPEGVDGYYAEWQQTLFDALDKQFLKLSKIDDHVLLPPEFSLRVDSDSPAIDYSLENLNLTRTGTLVRGRIAENTRITAEDHFQDVRHLVLESNEPVLNYSPGDTCALYPPNDEKSVELLLNAQPHWLPIADKPLQILSSYNVEGGLIDPAKLTLRTLLTYHLDIMSIPRRSFFSTVFHFVDDSTEDGQREKERLHEFSKLEDSEELYNYANRPRRLILETILEFENNLKIPVEYVLDVFPAIKVRLFLIASCPSPSQVELVVGVVEYKTMLRRIRRGLCTKWIKTLLAGDELVFSTHPSGLSFVPPTNPDAPILMISPGTGIAPMKSVIEAFRGKKVLHLFYGFRDSTKDYLFKNKWLELAASHELFVHSAISREAGSKHKYVQDRLFAEKDLVADLIVNQNCIVFVCGLSGNMPRQVRITLVESISALVEDAEAYFSQMELLGRYIQETW